MSKNCKCTVDFNLSIIDFSCNGNYIQEIMRIRQEIAWCKNLLSLAKARIKDNVPLYAEILYREALGYYECNLTKVTNGSTTDDRNCLS